MARRLNTHGSPPDCYTIDEFRNRHRISRSAYYKMRKEGRGPAVFHISRRALISKEAAERWRAAREAEDDFNPNTRQVVPPVKVS